MTGRKLWCTVCLARVRRYVGDRCCSKECARFQAIVVAIEASAERIVERLGSARLHW
jgi:hypothetical protein